MKFFKRKNIYRTGDNERQLYMIRWNIFSCRWFSIKLHKVILSDEDCLHDHPFSFVSLILWGGYYEWIETDKWFSSVSDPENWKLGPNNKWLNRQWRRPGSILIRPANTFHRLEITKPCYTCVIATRKFRPWGFMTKWGWMHFEEYNSDFSCD